MILLLAALCPQSKGKNKLSYRIKRIFNCLAHFAHSKSKRAARKGTAEIYKHEQPTGD